jgi:hypothetical protein
MTKQNKENRGGQSSNDQDNRLLLGSTPHHRQVKGIEMGQSLHCEFIAITGRLGYGMDELKIRDRLGHVTQGQHRFTLVMSSPTLDSI